MSRRSSGAAAAEGREALGTLVGSLKKVERYVREEGYEGVDPYDALASPYFRSLPGILPKIAMTQLLVYSPINLRKAFKIAPGRNPKAIGLFLSSYCNMFRAGLMSREQFASVSGDLVGSLLSSRIEGYHGNCWGIYFDVQEADTTIKPDLPSIVPTSFAANGFLDLYEATGEERHLDLALSCCDFITRDLNIHESGEGIYFSYWPNDHKAIHNANMLGAAVLARAYHHSGGDELLSLSTRAVDFTVGHQGTDGSWAYSIDAETGRQRFQIDYHQGFVIDCLVDYMRFSGADDPKYDAALRRGATFYRERQFDDLGRSMWRLPWRWPIDIHHQAQGIATFAKLWDRGPDYLPFAVRIADWTIASMQDRTGYFYHQKYPLGANKNSYMRWSQAWMLFSLSQLLRFMSESGSAGPGGEIQDDRT
jgi:hypothetical protein